MKPALLILLMLGALAPPVSARDFEQLSPNIQSMLLRSAEQFGLGNRTIDHLPTAITAPETGVSLFADFDHAAADGSIPVYLINRTGKTLRLGNQDRDVYLKLEFQDTDGQWKRAQSHQLSWCGNSYFSTPVLSGHFVALAGQPPASGERARIRFRLYRQTFDAVSNDGEGFIRRAEAEAAPREKFAVVGGTFEELAAVARGETQPAGWKDGPGARVLAIVEIGTRGFAREAVEKVLRPIASGDGDRFADAAQEALAQKSRGPLGF